MIRRLIAHDFRSHHEYTLMEADEKEIVKYCFANWPGLNIVPVFEWFCPQDLSLSTTKYIITNVEGVA